jgi:prepilin-type N-terminal cleavage/methylation domain-containing protein/prepilin-type processing-associated H-X9-DG protein
MKGFTLIELLVVIAIIAILAAILFPVFAQARDKARSAACLSNTKQQALAFHMYAQDYDETMVPLYGYGDWGACYPNCPRLGHFPWNKLLIPYVKSKEVYTCPSFPAAKWDNDRIKNAYKPSDCPDISQCPEYEFPSVIGYGLNSFLSAKSLGAIDKPAETVAIAETRYYPPDHPWYQADWGWYIAHPGSHLVNATGGSLLDPNCTEEFKLRHNLGNRPCTYGHTILADRHQNGQNVSWADGHAKFIRWDRLTAPDAAGLWDGRGTNP